jgi:hypothetical protein
LASFNSPAELAQAYLKAGDWRSGLAEDIKAEKSLESFKDIGSLAKSYVESQKMIGGSVRIPKEDAPPEEWAKFHAKLGVPESPDKYEFKRPALGEGAAWDANFEKNFLTQAHAMGLNSKQVQKLMDLQAGFVEEQLRGLATKRQETVAALKKEWGEDFNRRLELAGRAKAKLQELAKITEEEANDYFDGTGAGDHPVILKIFHQLGEIFAEDGWIKGETGATMLQNVQEQINSIRNDPQDPYNIKDHPKHDERVVFVNKLYDRLYPAR